MLFHLQILRTNQQTVAIHEVCTNTRKIAFGQLRETAEEFDRNDAVQHGVADELQTFIVIGIVTAVRQRSREERRIAEGIAQPLFDRRHFRFEVSKSNKRLTL